jgi:hypothetical protein
MTQVLTIRERVGLRKLTLTASLAAVYTIFRAIPISTLIGTSGRITAAGMAAPLIGFLLEPSYGIAAVFVGTIIASLFPWNPIKFYGLDFIPGALNVTLVSLMVRGRRTEATILFLVTIGLFIINPYTRFFVGSSLFSPPVPYLWMHFVALLVLVSPLSKNIAVKIGAVQLKAGKTAVKWSWRNFRTWPKIIRWLITQNGSPAGAIAVLAFTGTMIEHVSGGILYATVVGSKAVTLWSSIFLVYPIERIVLVAGAILICTPVLQLLKVSATGRSFEAIAEKTNE